MKIFLDELTKAAIVKTINALSLVEASLNKIKPYDPTRLYTPDRMKWSLMTRYAIVL